MSEKSRKTEIENIQEAVSSLSKKPKHNSKRRKCKKKQTFELCQDSSISKIDEIVNFLCNTISKTESETSVDINPPMKIAKESTKNTESSHVQKENREANQGSVNCLPSTSNADISYLFQNLQMHTSNNLIKSNNITDFLNINLLKENNCESLSLKDLEKCKQNKPKKFLYKNEKNECTQNENLKEYFNLKLIQKCPKKTNEQMDSSSVLLVSELEQTLHSSLPRTEENAKKNICFYEFFNAGGLITTENSLVSSVQSTRKLPADELEKSFRKNESFEKKKFSKRREKNHGFSNELPDTFFEGQKSPFTSALHQKKNLSESGGSAFQSQSKNRKRQHRSKSSGCDNKSDTTFPDYLSPEELELVSNVGDLLTGIIRINPKNFREAYITAPDKGMDILIEGLRDRNRALEGDEVYFVLKPKEYYRTNVDNTDVQRTAVVVAIKTLNHSRGAIGTLNAIKNKNVNFAVFSPRDSRLPRIRIRKNNLPEGFLENCNNFKDRLYFAKISRWNDLRYADGEISKEVGLVGDIEAETNAILLKYDLDGSPYSDDLKQFIPPISYKISETEINQREDFRKACVFTIDPATAVDLDDAMSCKKLPNGNYEVGAHISDVSFFLKEGTPLDVAVSQRATTVYLVQRAYHMLPYELCRLCSLTPGEDKLAFSVLWEITPDCKIVSHRFTRAIINSCAQFSYDQIQSIINNLPLHECALPKIHGEHSIETIKEIVLFLHKVAVSLRYKRFKNGALRIEQKKISFFLNENLLPMEYKVEIHEESHQLIEEFMLLANITVAEKLIYTFPKIAFLRSHSPPLTYILEKLQKSLEKYGIIIDISSSGSLQSSLSKYSGDDIESVARISVLNNLIAKPMARAKYYCSSLHPEEEDRRHYALNVPLYTHFTSPIRRYADVMVHRLLAASLGYSEPPNWTIDYVHSIASNCNKQKYAAKLAGEMSTELFLSVYIGLRGSVICEAVVCDIKDKSFDCIVLPTGAHQRLYFENIKGEIGQEKEDGILRLIVKWPKDEIFEKETVEIIEMFSIVKIQLKRTATLKIEAILLRCE